uniref:Beta-lactamase domain-containing protein n=1 Tax=Meloidogyne hapla TaxID=6305 RepID=A0A1I8C235_MELHA
MVGKEKAVAALAIHMLVERHSIAYSDAVAKFWPEFAKNGKENVTLEDLLNHKAGLAAIDIPILIEDALSNPKKISEILELQKPNWEPGTKSGYHAVSFGWLTDQLGLSMPNRMYIIREIFYDPRVLVFLGILHIRNKNSLRSRMARNPEWINANSKICTLNNPELFPIEQAGALGIGKAKDLARIFALLLSGEFLSRKTLEYISRPQMIDHRDVVLMVPVSKGNGFMYERHPYKKVKENEHI